MCKQPNFDSAAWAEQNFGGCDLADQRRSHRLLKVAQQSADRPAASLPKIGEDWGGTRGIYRLLDNEHVTLESVTQTHRKLVTQQPGRFIVISDTSHIDFGWNRDLPDAGPIGPGRGRGFLLHSGLLVDAEDGALLGLAGQVAHVRSGRRKGKQNDAMRLKRWRESEMWLELFEQIGSPPEHAQYIHVCDSAADNFEVFCAAQTAGCEFAIRVGRRNRQVLAEGQKMPVSQAICGLPELGRYELQVAAGGGRRARTALLRVSAQAIELPLPSHCGKRAKAFAASGSQSILASLVVVEELDPPSTAEPIEWLLLTSLPVESFEAACEVIGWYKNRWLIEEWHKALKSGCRLESRQLQRVDRLLPLTGILSVVAVLLVKLKTAARICPDQPACRQVPALWLKLLQAKRKIKSCEITNYEFWRGVARLGGFLGRRHDGEPGWQTIWRGWQELHTLAEGVHLAKRCG